MQTSQKGLDLIKRFEGFSARPYTCPAGKLTIGYGHVIKPAENLTKINTEQAETLLRGDVGIAEACIKKNVKIELSQNEFDALTSFIYNIGSQAFEKSYLLRLLNAENREGAAGQFMKNLMALARMENSKVIPLCGYAASWLRRHSEYDDLKIQE